MSESKHTPGPWTIAPWCREGAGTVRFYVRVKPRIGIASVIGRSMEEAEANTHLIVAAPEMLQWLDKIVTILEGEPLMWRTAEEDLIEARRVVKKARGSDV